jgi:hypothetical protein
MTGEKHVGAMVARWFEIEGIFKSRAYIDGEIGPLVAEQNAIVKAVIERDSDTERDFVAKLRLALRLASDDKSIWLQLPDLLLSLGDDYWQMRDRVDEAEYEFALKAGSYEDWFRLKGIQMAERPTA